MGSGKSSVGRALAGLLRVDFVDLDERVELEARQGIQAIFEQEGEAGFRLREQASLMGLEPGFQAGAVIATGGGTFVDPELRAWMLARGVCVWLDAELDAIERRVARDGSRPLFGDRAALEKLHGQRSAAYAEAPLRVDTSATEPLEAAHALVRAMQDRARG